MTQESNLKKAAFPEAPHLEAPTGDVVAWFTEPSGILIQVTRPTRIEVRHAEWIVGPLRAEALRRFPDRENAVLIIDSTLMTGREPAVRTILMEAAREVRQHVARTILIPPSNAGPVYLASLEVACSILQVFGIRLDIVRSLPFVLSSLGVRALQL